jgi:hypothetical protein
MVHIAALHKEIEKGEFAIQFVKEDGSVVDCKRCICTSFHAEGTTLNVKLCDSREIRTVVRTTIISFNGEEAYL